MAGPALSLFQPITHQHRTLLEELLARQPPAAVLPQRPGPLGHPTAPSSLGQQPQLCPAYPLVGGPNAETSNWQCSAPAMMRRECAFGSAARLLVAIMALLATSAAAARPPPAAALGRRLTQCSTQCPADPG